MKVKRLPLSWYTEKLALNEPFTFARYGDGEWLTILGRIGLKNSNGCTFTQELSDDLVRVLKRQNLYQHAILTIAKRKQGDEITQYLQDNKINLRWYNGDLLLDALLNGDLYPFIRELRRCRIVTGKQEVNRHCTSEG